MSDYSGRLVVFEGIDNAGKTTQIQRVADWLESEGWNTLISREMRTGIGKCFRSEFEAGQLSPRVKALLFAADRHHRLETEIVPALEQGVIVLADRWSLSSLVYRTIEGSGVKLAEFINKDAKPPDVIFLIDIDPNLAYHRGQIANRHNPYTTGFLRLARRCYLEIAEREKLVVVDGSQSVKQVTASIMEHLVHLLRELK